MRRKNIKVREKADTDDLENVLQRATDAGVEAQIITAGSLSETHDVLELAKSRAGLYGTAGCHPTRSTELDTYKGGPSAYMAALKSLVDAHHGKEGRIVAIGECGLGTLLYSPDYDRLHFAPAEAQKRSFDLQLTLAEQTGLPLFLHSRAAHADFVAALRPHLGALRRAWGAPPEPSADGPGCVGVVHSFTGTSDELHELLSLGLYVGVNGCSLKTQENLDVVKQIPLHRIMLETDAPWCDIRPTHASAPYLDQFRKSEPSLAALYSPAKVKPEKWTASSAVKGRNEPCQIGEVAAVAAALHQIGLEDLAGHAYINATRLFRLS